MKKIAFVFPGQGSQYIGMGKDFYDKFSVCKNVYDKASEVTGLDVAQICFEENDQINITEYTQISLLTTEIAIYKAIQEYKLSPDVTAGLSLGEYGALVASEALSMEDAFRLVRKRGIFMQEEVPEGGSMAAVIGLDDNIVNEECMKNKGIVSIANYNCPGQVVITGEEKAVKEVSDKLTTLYDGRCIPLIVSGPFHSIMLKGAGYKLEKELESISFKEPQIPYLSNVTADYIRNSTFIKDLLKKQVYSSVMWKHSIMNMINNGVDTFVEIGPGKTLTLFLRQIDKSCTGISVQTVDDLGSLIKKGLC